VYSAQCWPAAESQAMDYSAEIAFGFVSNFSDVAA